MIFRKERHSYCFDSADDLGYFLPKGGRLASCASCQRKPSFVNQRYQFKDLNLWKLIKI
jgi:hypothetical protein